MYWADKVANEIIKSGKYRPYHVDDMFTPSGFAHAGSLRGPLIHDLIYKALKGKGVDVEFTYVFNDFDPIDGLPKELEKKFSKYLGVPLKKALSPDNKLADNFADYFANDFKAVLNGLGVAPKFLSSWNMYHEGKFDEVIKEALDNAATIQDIYQEVSGSKKREQSWLPFQVICENDKCGKLGTTRVYDWDGATVAYKCEPTLVKWAVGCGNEGRISPFGGKGKLPWKVDWPAHWKVLGVTIEGAGKDHASAGGSLDVAKELCKKVFNYPEPYSFGYEFFLIGGRKMASSKGLGIHARDLWHLIPRNLIRFLISRTDYRQAINFDPVGNMVVPDLYDEYDRCWRAYNSEDNPDLARTFELAQIDPLPSKNSKLYIPRFRDVANYLQLLSHKEDIEQKFEEMGVQPASDASNVLIQRMHYAQEWLGNYAPEEAYFRMSEELPESAKDLTDKQKEFLGNVITLLEHEEDPGKLQETLYIVAKDMRLASADAFAAIYLAMMGKTHGPKAGWFLLQYPKDQVVKRLQEAIQ